MKKLSVKKKIWLICFGILALRIVASFLIFNDYTEAQRQKEFADLFFDGKLPYTDFNYEYPPLTFFFVLVPRLFFDQLPDYIYGFRGWIALLEIFTIWGIYLLGKQTFKLNDRKTLVAIGFYAVTSTINTWLVTDRWDGPFIALMMYAIYFAAKRKEGLTYFLLACATSIKMIPVFFVPVFIAYFWQNKPQTKTILMGLSYLTLFGMLINGPFLLLSGRDFFQFITYHSDRGIQIETIYASILLMAKYFGVYVDMIISYGSYNITTHFDSTLKHLATVLTLGGQVTLIFYSTRFFVAKKQAPESFLFVAVILQLMVLTLFNKVFSPQFLLWMYPFIGIYLVQFKRPQKEFVLWILAAVLTTWLFPFQYTRLVQLTEEPRFILLARNLIFAHLTWQIGKHYLSRSKT